MKITEVELNNSKSGIYGLMRFYINIPNSNGGIKEKLMYNAWKSF